MPRQPRTASSTGIYHVMLRGIRSALPLATAGTQERHGELHRTAEIYTPKSRQGGHSRKGKGLRVQLLGRVRRHSRASISDL